MAMGLTLMVAMWNGTGYPKTGRMIVSYFLSEMSKTRQTKGNKKELKVTHQHRS
jgi:hypothetical protein